MALFSRGTGYSSLRQTCVFWRGINKDIEKTVRECDICQKYQNSQQHETLLQHDVPEGPWQVVGTDIFHVDGQDYLLVTDYFSEMPFVRHMPGHSTSNRVITLMKQIFSEHGIPRKVVSDNGPQYSGSDFSKFATESGLSIT